jgi:hypothetical protein
MLISLTQNRPQFISFNLMFALRTDFVAETEHGPMGLVSGCHVHQPSIGCRWLRYTIDTIIVCSLPIFIFFVS